MIYIYIPLRKGRVSVLSLSALNLQSVLSTLLCSYTVEMKYNWIRVLIPNANSEMPKTRYFIYVLCWFSTFLVLICSCKNSTDL